MSRADKIRQVAQQAHDNGECECDTVNITTNVAIQAEKQPMTIEPAANHYERSDTVTITISREDAELLANPQYVVPIGDDPLSNVIRAARAALEGER